WANGVSSRNWSSMDPEYTPASIQVVQPLSGLGRGLAEPPRAFVTGVKNRESLGEGLPGGVAVAVAFALQKLSESAVVLELLQPFRACGDPVGAFERVESVCELVHHQVLGT